MVEMSYKTMRGHTFLKRLKPRADIAFVVIAILLIVFPIFVRDSYSLHIIILSLIFSILAASWNFLVGYTGIFSLAHQAFFGIGAYVSAIMAIRVGVSPWFGLIIGGIIAGLSSIIIGLPCLRLRAAPYIAIATLAFAEISRLTCMNLGDITRGERGLWGIPIFPDINLPWFGVISFAGGVRLPYYYLILLIFIIMMVLFYFIIHSFVGLAFRSIRESQDAAESLGVNISYYKLLAFITGGFFAGVAGGFYAHYILILTPTSILGPEIMIDILMMTIVGGIGTFIGPMLGAFLITLGLEYLRILQDYRLMAFGALLIVIILFVPGGIGRNLFREKVLLE
jgi:branched-chain amino acid transport system permease protein